MDKLRQILKEKKITQTELSNLTGIKIPQLNRYIHNINQPSMEVTLKIMKALNVKFEDLVSVPKKEKKK